MQLEEDALLLLLGQHLAVALVRPFVCEVCEVIRLQLDSVEFVVAAEFLHLLLRLLLAQHHLAVFVARELIEQVFGCEFLAVTRLCAKLLGDGEVRHDRT